MALHTFFTGQKPKDPLVVPVTKSSDGLPVNLTIYDDVDVIFRDSDGDLVIDAGSSTAIASTNQAVYSWGTASIFTYPGIYSVTVKMVKSGGIIDYSSVGEIEVKKSLDYDVPLAVLVSAEDVYLRAGVTAGIDDILLAQSVIEDDLGMDLSVAPYVDGSTFFDDISANDLHLLMKAIAWQVKYLQTHPEALSALSNVVGASVNGVSVTYAQDGSEGFLAPLAKQALSRLSWRRNGFRTLIPTGPYTEVSPDTWVTQWRQPLP